MAGLGVVAPGGGRVISVTQKIVIIGIATINHIYSAIFAQRSPPKLLCMSTVALHKKNDTYFIFSLSSKGPLILLSVSSFFPKSIQDVIFNVITVTGSLAKFSQDISQSVEVLDVVEVFGLRITSH